MHNDFVLVGPPSDPAGIKGMTDSAAAMKKIAEAKAPFVSRGDDSGTHAKERDLWKATGLPLETKVTKMMMNDKEVEVKSDAPAGDWYLSIGQGMGKTLTFADEKQGYTLADRGTYINYKYGKQPAVELDILCEGDGSLANPYGVIPVSPEKYPHVKFDLAKQFAEWLVSERGQSVIANYQVLGKLLFFPDAMPNVK
jgi:tungstate transport system substrate-binding protein